MLFDARFLLIVIVMLIGSHTIAQRPGPSPDEREERVHNTIQSNDQTWIAGDIQRAAGSWFCHADNANYGTVRGSADTQGYPVRHIATKPPEEDNRWSMLDDGSIAWNISDNKPHTDHIEMSGEKISAIIRYGVDSSGGFTENRTLVWPMLRTIPNDTHASFIREFSVDLAGSITVNDSALTNESVRQIKLKGLIDVASNFTNGISLQRTLFPSTSGPSFIELFHLKNNRPQTVTVTVPLLSMQELSNAAAGVTGSYRVTVRTVKDGTYHLTPGEHIDFGLVFSAMEADKQNPIVDIKDEEVRRKQLVERWMNNLVMETPDAVLNRMFAFAKIRLAESIFRTKQGLMHSPGGGAYYAAIWANDQAEYAGPFFPFLGYQSGNEASLNAYLHFARYMNPAYDPIPSSIIAEGTGIWNGAGDRGDAAMIAYGASRFAMECGNREWADRLWPLIEWCLEYTRRKLNGEGVPTSDHDELEGRFPAGKANLSTASLYYDALRSAAMLAGSLNKPKAQTEGYRQQADVLDNAIEKYFGRKVSGFNTYRYYDGNDRLRSWICVPLTMGIYTRKKETIDALFSPGLWTADGLATLEGDTTFWDRSTLYAFRGILQTGETSRLMPYLQYYSRRRLLGEHVPYAVEAFPEGNQRHLSAESGLYCRIFTEGLFGIRPVSLSSFNCTPQLPKTWNKMSLRSIHLFGKTFDLQIDRKNERELTVTTIIGKIKKEYVISAGNTLLIDINAK